MARSGRGAKDTTERSSGVPGAAPARRALLVIGEGGLTTHDLGERDAVIGRDDDCDVVIDHPKLSRRHALIATGSPPTVRDLGSTNGTRVGGAVRRGGDAIALRDDETFRIGPFTFAVVPRTGGVARSATGRDLLRVVDPSTAGATALVRDLARLGGNVLILGETGVGKEVLAATIHELSGRDGAFVRINCAALSESLLESELFGHEKGAFTGAVAQRPGLLEAAAGGTAFLDEIGELPLAIQAKLLRAVEHHEITRLGGVRPTAIDVRFVAATNRDLPAEVAAGRFRRDLFFRLDGVTLTIPPLRERRALMGRLALRFLDDALTRAGRGGGRLAPEVVAALEAYGWPGNVRELRAVIDRAVLLARGREIGVRHLAFAPAPADEAPAAAAAPADSPADLTDAQRRDRALVIRTLEDHAGNQTRTARQLGISRTTLVGKLRLYRIPRPRT